MEIRLDNLVIGEFDVREEVDDKQVEELAESLESDGQWNPIIVRPSEDGEYEIISGHTRYHAAKSLGWETLEATVKDIDEDEAKELSLKTNLKRQPMTELEEGQVVNDLLDRTGLSEEELADRLGKSSSWVNSRIRVALDLAPEVKGLVQEGEISYTIAREIRLLDDDNQLDFAKMLIDQGITDTTKARTLRKQFENDTIYTIGYEGRDFDEFVSELQDAEVDILVDVRASGDSTYKPEFGSDLLSERLPERGIEYRHEPDLGVHRMIRNPYKDGAIGHGCFENWYNWWLDEESDIDVAEFAHELVQTGVPALMCIERYAEPSDGQTIHCHRDHLADRMQSIEEGGRSLFPHRVNL